MSNLYFPQLSTGALTQYPVKRTKAFTTTPVECEDGTRSVYLDAAGTRMQWDLTYTGLTADEIGALRDLFDACYGRYRSFTFIDPTANLLGGTWTADALIQRSGLVFTNLGSTAGEVRQILATPSGYTYCFSLAGNPAADPSATLTLIRRGTTAEQQVTLPANMKLLVSSGALADTGATFTAALRLQPGQSVDLGQAQLEAQPAPSPLRNASKGVYPNAHWAVDELSFTAQGPNSFSTKFSIETHV